MAMAEVSAPAQKNWHTCTASLRGWRCWWTCHRQPKMCRSRTHGTKTTDPTTSSSKKMTNSLFIDILWHSRQTVSGAKSDTNADSISSRLRGQLDSAELMLSLVSVQVNNFEKSPKFDIFNYLLSPEKVLIFISNFWHFQPFFFVLLKLTYLVTLFER